MMIRNGNPAFGDVGPFEADSYASLADEMQNSFEQWADDQEARWACDVFYNPGVPDLLSREARIAEMRREFIAGLEVEIAPGITVKEV